MIEFDNVWHFLVDAMFYGFSIAGMLEVICSPVGAAREWLRRSVS